MLPISLISGAIKNMQKAESRTLNPAAVKNAVESRRSAVSRSPRPRCTLIRLPDPCPSMKPKAWMIDCTPSTIPIAALALVPSFPTKNASTRL